MQRRDFTQPVQRDSPYYTVADQAESKKSTEELATEILRIQKQQRRKRNKKICLILLVVLAISAILFGAYSLNQHKLLAARVPADIRKEVPFPIYIPQPSSPSETKKESFSYSNSVLTYRVTYKSFGLTVTEQEKPANFQLGNFRDAGGLSNVQEFSALNGNGLAGTVMNHSIAILSTDTSLITVTTQSDTSPNELQQFTQSLRKL